MGIRDFLLYFDVFIESNHAIKHFSPIILFPSSYCRSFSFPPLLPIASTAQLPLLFPPLKLQITFPFQLFTFWREFHNSSLTIALICGTYFSPFHFPLPFSLPSYSTSRSFALLFLFFQLLSSLLSLGYATPF